MADAGVVAVRFTIANAEVVRQALLALGKDGEKALSQFDTSAQPAQEQLNALGAIIDVVRGRAAGLASQGGGVTTAISRWGPAGLAAGAALGVAALSITKMALATEEFAAKAQGIRDLANVLRLTTLQVQALNDAGGKASITQEDMSRAMGRFAGLTQDARKAQGDFFETVRRLNPELADQLLRTTDQAQALDLLAAAYAKAGTGAQRADLAKLLGKDVAAFGNFLQQIHAAGGVNAMANVFSPEAIPQETIEKVTKLRIDIAQIKERTANIWSGMFAADVLENQRRTAQLMLEIAEAAERAAKARKDYLEAEREAAARGDRPSISDAPLPPAVADQSPAQSLREGEAALSRLVRDRDDLERQRPFLKDRLDLQALEEQLQKIDRQIKAWKDYLPEVRAAVAAPLPPSFPGLRNVPLPPSAPPRPQGELDPAARLELLRKEMALLGTAATPAEQYRLRLAEINAVQKAANLSQDKYNRAVAGAAAAFHQAVAAVREHIGVATEQEMLTQRLRDLDDQQAKGFIKNAQERAESEKLVRKEVHETAQALAVRKSDTPALTQLAQDAGDLTKSLDSGLAGALRGATSDLYAMFAGTQTLGQGFSSLAGRIAEAIAQAIIMRSIVGPIAGAISGLIPGAAPAVSGPDLQGGIWPSALGNVFNDGRIIPFKSGGVITRPILFPMANGMGLAGEAGEEGILPLRRGGDGRLGVSAYGAGGGLTVRMFIEDRAGVSITRRQAPAGFDMGILIDSVDQGLAQRQQDGTGAHAQVLKQDFGVERKFR